ncbi:MAG TPA: DUF2341 domain-containing protein [Chitinispirillaceae bacterium]|nr:DUF2341 domain-containing protein [Chitinispirillaceae bacterium]
MIKNIFLFFTCISMFIRCTPDTAGGTADTGNAKVAAIIYTSDGKRAAGVSVVCCPDNYLANPVSDISGIGNYGIIHTVTDDSGYFAMDSINCGNYIVEVNDNESSVVSFHFEITDPESSVTPINDTLKPYSILKGNAGQITDSSMQRFLLIYGLDRRVAIDINGAFELHDLPDGQFDMRIVSDNQDWIPIEIDSINLVSDQTVLLPFAGWSRHCSINLNTTTSGADVKENVYDFPILLRLFSNDFDFSDSTIDESDLIFTNRHNARLSFEIEQWDRAAKTACIWVFMDTVYGDYDIQAIDMLWGNPNNTLLRNNKAVFDSADGFLGCYHLNGNVSDASANRYSSIDSGSIDNKDGIIGRARSFDGTSSFFLVKDLPERPSGSISCWFRPGLTLDRSNPKTRGIWGKKMEDDHDFTLSIQGSDFFSGTGSAGNIITKLEDPEGGEYLSSNTSTFLAGIWYFISWSWGNATDSLYVNGVLENSISNCRPVTGDSADEIGRSLYDASNVSDGAAGYFYGTIDEFRFDTKIRSASWVKLCYMNQRTDQKLITINK